VIFVLAFVLSALLVLVCFTQLLYLEALRLRTRDTAALAFFKETLEDRLGYDTEQGAFVFSLLKHTLLVLTGAAMTIVALLERNDWAGALEGVLSGWGVMLAAGYIVPQVLFRRSSGHWALPLVPLLRCMALLFRPLTALLGFLHSLFELGSPQAGADEPEPGDEIAALITAGEEEGIIEKEDSRLIQNVVAYGDKRVREVMTPRREIVAMDVHGSLDELRQLAKHQQYSRIPVFDGSIDNLMGFVHVRDLYELDDAQRATKTIADLRRDLIDVPETMPVAELQREMQRDGRQIVSVYDEYGRLAGLATMEDLVEEVFGEIRDEHEPPHDIARGADGSVVVAGAFDVDHLAELFSFRPAEGTQATTVGGLASEWFGAVPRPGEVIERDGLRLEILAADDYRVDQLRVSRTPPPEENENDE
jgi:CBS domain containing-hemolysin-like protein